MGNVAISVEGLGKRYRIGSGPKEPYGSLRESMVRAAQAPLRRLRGSERRPDAKDIWALRDVSFEVKHGEAVGIIGRNGAGKSTLLKLLSRITEPTAGRAVVHGRVGSLLEVGTGFHPELTGRENIFLNGAVMGMSRAEIKRHFDEIVDFSGVEQFLDTPVKRYSSGMYMRLAFSVAAHLEPEVLVVDEVLAVGDAEFQKKCLGKMSEVADEGRTVLFVSHNMAAMLNLCRWGILLQEGQIASTGNMRQIVDSYLDQQATAGRFRRPAGQGTGRFRITNVELQSRGEQVSQIMSGEDLDVAVHIDVLEKYDHLCVEFALRDAVGYQLAFCSSGLHYYREFRVEPGEYVFTARFRNLPLAEGDYSFDIILARAGQERFEDLHSCISFGVVASTIGPGGWVYRQNAGQGGFALQADSFYMIRTAVRPDQYGQGIPIS